MKICFHFSFLFCHVGGPYNTSSYAMLNLDKLLPAVLALFNTATKGVFLKSELASQRGHYLKIKCYVFLKSSLKPTTANH